MKENDFPVQEVGEKECEHCGSTFKLYKSPVGIVGRCKPCSEKEFINSLDLPTPADLKKKREREFIAGFEHVTSDLLSATVNSYLPDKKFESQFNAKRKVIAFVKDFDGTSSLVLSGDPGVGKSHLAYSVAKAIRAKGKKVLYIKVTDLLEHIRSTYKNNSKLNESDIFRMIEGLDLLVLDDIGSEYVKQNEFGHESWASDILYKIFDMRMEKSIICTTNYRESELVAKYGNNGPRIISRMMNLATPMRIEGNDNRRKEAF